MITLIGTGHVFDLTAALQSVLDEKNPDVICVELDTQRYQTLLLRERDPERYRQKTENLPTIYRLLARFQERMAREYGVHAGSEMFTAIQYAQTHGLPIEFIDMNAQRLFQSMMRSMSLMERLRLIISGLTSFFVSKKRVEKEIERYEQNFESMLEEVGEKLPTIKHTLIDQRNEYMISRLVKVDEEYEQVVACVGDGHILGLSELLDDQKIAFEVVRLSELRAVKKEPADGSSAHFSIKYTS